MRDTNGNIKIIASFFTEQECHEYIERKGLDKGRNSVLIEKDIFSGKYNIMDLS
jgi:hypothetical protein